MKYLLSQTEDEDKSFKTIVSNKYKIFYIIQKIKSLINFFYTSKNSLNQRFSYCSEIFTRNRKVKKEECRKNLKLGVPYIQQKLSFYKGGRSAKFGNHRSKRAGNIRYLKEKLIQYKILQTFLNSKAVKNVRSGTICTVNKIHHSQETEYKKKCNESPNEKCYKMPCEIFILSKRYNLQCIPHKIQNKYRHQ